MRISVRELIGAALFAALIAAGALASFPLPPFPGKVTLQIFFVLLCARALPPLPSFLAVFAYIALGLCGVPILSMGGGLQYVLQPTFGYLLGFLAGAPLASRLYRLECFKARPRLRHTVPGAALLLVSYAAGAPYLGFIMNTVMNAGLTWQNVLVTGCVIFLPIDAVKVALVYPAGNLLDRIHASWA